MKNIKKNLTATLKNGTFLLLFLCLSSFFSCTKVMVYASDHVTDAVVKSYKLDPGQLYHQTIRLLEQMNYEIISYDETAFQIVTGWKPVTSSSHYLELFGRKDFAASDGSYYQLQISFIPEGNFARVEVSTKIKTAAGKLSSSKTLEKKFLTRLSDAVRSPQIEITNVGLENK